MRKRERMTEDKPLGLPVRSYASTFSAVPVVLAMFRLQPTVKPLVEKPAVAIGTV